MRREKEKIESAAESGELTVLLSVVWENWLNKWITLGEQRSAEQLNTKLLVQTNIGEKRELWMM